MAEIKTWTVLSNRKNVEKILDHIDLDELQKAFAPRGVALKIDETLDGPFIGFFSIKSQEALYMTPVEFVEAVKGDLWGAQRDYRKILAEKKKEEEDKKKKPVPDKFQERKPRNKKKKSGGRVIG